MARPLVRSTRGRASAKDVTEADYRQTIFTAPRAISTIKGSGAHQFQSLGFRILFSCHRTYEMERILSVFKPNSTPGYSHEQQGLGLRIHCSEDRCILFPVAGQNITTGERFFHALLKDHGRLMLASVSLQVCPIQPPTRASVTTNIRMQAAMNVFNSSIKKAEQELADEIARIMELDYAERKQE